MSRPGWAAFDSLGGESLMSQTFYFPHDTQLVLGSARQKADMNFQILMLLKTLDQEGRSATVEEQDLLSHYIGWGDSAVLSCRYSEVAEATTNEEFKSLQASTLNAHYTALPIIRAMWSGIVALGGN
jgi:hypothetical protein